jgi:DNA-binding transcriptional ArsR family regulator
MKKKPKVDVFAAIGDPTRRQILFLLTAGALSINALAENFNISRPAVSKHVKTLEEAGLISIEDKGRERYCGLHPAGFGEIRDWLDFYEKFWHSKLHRLGKLLNKQSKHKKQ